MGRRLGNRLRPQKTYKIQFWSRKRLRRRNTQSRQRRKAAKMLHPPQGLIKRILYLFAGEARKSSVTSFLRDELEALGFAVTCDEIDLLRDPSHNLDRSPLRSKLLDYAQ